MYETLQTDSSNSNNTGENEKFTELFKTRNRLMITVSPESLFWKKSLHVSWRVALTRELQLYAMYVSLSRHCHVSLHKSDESQSDRRN